MSFLLCELAEIKTSISIIFFDLCHYQFQFFRKELSLSKPFNVSICSAGCETDQIDCTVILTIAEQTMVNTGPSANQHEKNEKAVIKTFS